MGTNFYIKKHLTPEQKRAVIEKINNDQYDEAQLIMNEAKDIHIGKRSAGWQFLWDANDFKYFKPTKRSLIEWLKSGQIIDESGREFTFDEFWNNCLKRFWDGYNTITYPGESYWNPNIKESHGIPVTKGEFYIDNLRFSVNTGFV